MGNEAMRVYLDACAIIYGLEGTNDMRRRVQQWTDRAKSNPNGVILTSRLSRLECRVKPLREGNAALLARYDAFFALQTLSIVDISADVVERATQYRAMHNYRVADAIHLATAVIASADVLLTGDARLAQFGEVRVELL